MYNSILIALKHSKKVLVILLISLLLCSAQEPRMIFAQESAQRIEINNYTEYKIDDIQKEILLKKAKVLNWKEADTTIEINSSFVLIDYYTGSYICATRTGGGNHADIEATTRESANYFKQFPEFGSWKTRPVLIITEDGDVYCASMNMKYHAGVDGNVFLANVNNRSGGYGHGENYDKIENGLSGHHCLHFRGSRTHNTNEINKDHQSNIDKLEYMRGKPSQ